MRRKENLENLLIKKKKKIILTNLTKFKITLFSDNSLFNIQNYIFSEKNKNITRRRKRRKRFIRLDLRKYNFNFNYFFKYYGFLKKKQYRVKYNVLNSKKKKHKFSIIKIGCLVKKLILTHYGLGLYNVGFSIKHNYFNNSYDFSFFKNRDNEFQLLFFSNIIENNYINYIHKPKNSCWFNGNWLFYSHNINKIFFDDQEFSYGFSNKIHNLNKKNFNFIIFFDLSLLIILEMYKILIIQQLINIMLLGYSFNKTNSSRHKIYNKSFYTNDKKYRFFYKLKRKNSFKSLKNKIVFRGRKKHNSKSYLIENTNLFFKNKLGLCRQITFNTSKNVTSSFIVLANGINFYIKSPFGLNIGDFFKVMSEKYHFDEQMSFYYNEFFTPKLGNLVYLPSLGNVVVTFSLKNIYAKSGGTFCKIFKKSKFDYFYRCKLPSGKYIKIYKKIHLHIGRCQNIINKRKIIGNAGSNIKKGFKSLTRGVATNPVDHPNGGRTKTCKPLKNIWGKIAKKSK